MPFSRYLYTLLLGMYLGVKLLSAEFSFSGYEEAAFQGNLLTIRGQVKVIRKVGMSHLAFLIIQVRMNNTSIRIEVLAIKRMEEMVTFLGFVF